MTKRKPRPTDEELQDESFWDWESATWQPPVVNPRAVVSVSFPSADFQVVARAAEAAGLKLSEFIREAAIAAAGGRGAKAEMALTGVAGQVMLQTKSTSSTRLATELHGAPETGAASSSVA